MFHVYSPYGKVFTGTLEQIRQAAALSPVTKVKPAITVATGLDESAQDSAGTTPFGHAVKRAYEEDKRKPLTTVGDVMRRPSHVVRDIASVRDAWQLLSERNIGQAPVVDAQGKLVGLLTRAELLQPQRLAYALDDQAKWQSMLGEPVSQIMHQPVPSAQVDTDLRRVASLLLDTGLPGIPVTDDLGGVIGFVSRTDLLRALATDPPLDLWS